MESSPKQEKPPEGRQKANELIKLIRKLRWMGMEEEAKKAQAELAQCGERPADSVLATSRDTD
jgi:hypothetical protein